MIVLSAKDLTKEYGTDIILDKVSFHINKGERVGIIGVNGAGKTTLFNCLTDEVRADGGEAFLIDDAGSTKPLIPSQVGYVFSTPILPDFLTGYEFIRFYMDIHQGTRTPEKTIDEYFDMVKMDKEDRHKLIKGYSHGMKNKVQMLCFIIARPPVILLDEPLTSFDVVVALEIKQLLRELKQDHIIIFSTHILQLATDLCDEIAVLSEGNLQQIDHNLLAGKDFEERIIELLKDDNAHE